MFEWAVDGTSVLECQFLTCHCSIWKWFRCQRRTAKLPECDFCFLREKEKWSFVLHFSAVDAWQKNEYERESWLNMPVPSRTLSKPYIEKWSIIRWEYWEKLKACFLVVMISMSGSESEMLVDHAGTARPVILGLEVKNLLLWWTMIIGGATVAIREHFAKKQLLTQVEGIIRSVVAGEWDSWWSLISSQYSSSPTLRPRLFCPRSFRPKNRFDLVWGLGGWEWSNGSWENLSIVRFVWEGPCETQ